ncbi:MAG: rod shape-determining protein MreC [Candidatus Aenigmatarchaeota archaeon]
MRYSFKKFLLLYIIIILIFATNYNKTLAQEYSKIYIGGLSFQKIIQKIFLDIKKRLSIKTDLYKEKYFELLKEIAQMKIAEKEEAFQKSLEYIKLRYPNSTEVQLVYQGPVGVLYIKSKEKLKTNALVLDENWVLIGRIRKALAEDTYEVITLNHPGVQFNVANLEGKIIGLAKTTGLNYIEVDFVDLKTDIKIGDLITTGGDNIFPKSFLVGEIIDISKSQYFQKLIISLIGDFNAEKFIVIQ